MADAGSLDGRTVLYPYGCNNSSCGYCNVKVGNKSYMMLAGVDDTNTDLGITPVDYKDLLDRGWRRSGNILYKPDMKYSCCQEYTIRAPNKDGLSMLGSITFKGSITDESKRKNTLYPEKKVHEPEYDTLKSKNPIEPAHKLEIRLEENTFTEEKYKLFHHYQKAIHKDEKVSESGFKRFLCTNPFKPRFHIDEKGRKIGAYHQCYYYDGRLIAMAVLDLLPDCVSGVYFMYHTDFMQWNFGKLSALREISLAIEDGYNFYYMGYYIHTCPKMRYKCEYGPGLVLDPEYYDWHPFDDYFRSCLDKHPYFSLTQERKIEAGEIARPTGEEEARAAAMGHFDYESLGDPTPTVFTTRMSGVVTKDDLNPWLGDVLIVVGTRIAAAEMLGTWEHQNFDDPKSLKHKLAEVAATVGYDVTMRILRASDAIGVI
ncbi:hypothetical protein Dda_4439 [Drechslerella dactyloides]|uniref:Arginyl-tRNA--protein transferase 1 n=1 Tax=Drechslerella dactyloides TaxID=74499 RepID=A0AAD6NJA1_DREDA|nr:hypothetical protein Dda_4439 [Drechslerella dactyloides]